MGLLSSRNLAKAKSLLDKNRHKLGDVVDKATDQLDKVSKGKTSGVSAKVDDAARKYSAGGVTHTGLDAESVPPDPTSNDQVDDTDLQRRQTEAGIAAANSAKAAADALTNLANKASGQIDAADGVTTDPSGSTDADPPPLQAD